jgi:cephalosporin hydroxylase
MLYRHKIHGTINRLIAYLRPQATRIPALATEVLASLSGATLVDQFRDLYYGTRRDMSYRGIPIIKNPCDLWVTMEMMWAQKPCVLIETGTAHGGSATYYADLARMFGFECEVVTIDINPKWSFDPASKGVTSIVGYSTDPNIHAKITDLVRAARQKHGRPVILALDSDHSEANVLQELRMYADLVTVGSYAIVEDTNVNGHPSFASHGAGPWEAVQKFLSEDERFEVDPDCERHLLTFNPRGWLKRVR